MSTEPNKRQVRIFDAKTGQSRLSEPTPVHAPRQLESEGGNSSLIETSPSAAETPAEFPDSLATDQMSATSSDAGYAVPDVPQNDGFKALPSANSAPKTSTDRTPRPGVTSKPKPEIETLEQFVEYAYGRKGQRVSLKPKVERIIAQNPRLDNDALNRLQVLAESDVLLAVPRQLLLLSREIVGLPALRTTITSFVSSVILRHPAFAATDIQATFHNLPDAPSASDALTALLAYTPSALESKDQLKPAELQSLRRNAAHLLATWLASSRGFNSEELSALLFQAIWAPAARDLTDDNARIRALTEVDQPAGVGLACHRFRQQSVEARAAQDHAQREVGGLRQRLAEIEEMHRLVQAELETAQAKFAALSESTSAELVELHKQNEAERMHLRHSQEQLRGRLVRRLEEGVDMLDVGLMALRNRTPRVEVMVERAEHVVDALRVEITNLKGD